MLFTLLFLSNDRTDEQDNDYFRGNCLLKGQGLIKVVGITLHQNCQFGWRIATFE
jgi:hypothetical protein